MRGFARSILSAMSLNRLARAKSRPAAAGISAVSSAIALVADGSVVATFELVDRGAQVTAVSFEQICGPDAAQPETQQDGCLQIAVSLLEMASRVAFRTAHDLPNNGDRAAAQLGVPRPHVDHQAAIDPAHLHHHGGRKEVEYNLLCGAGVHPRGAGNCLASCFNQDLVTGCGENRSVRVVCERDCHRTR